MCWPVQLAFHQKRIEAIAVTIADCAISLLRHWQPVAERRLPLDSEYDSRSACQGYILRRNKTKCVCDV
jgi:hypothetical protein